TTLTRNLRPIEKLELITSVTVNDKRSKAYALTPKGHEVLKESIPLWEHAQKKIVDSVTPDRYIRILNELVLLKTATFTPKEKINKYKSQNAD
ncbi:MAG: MarR family transcriptional regulator, partial [Francisellaceae bacterium]|nr:MarR family transcriptional regulator [Francisellaceae bacterium]